MSKVNKITVFISMTILLFFFIGTASGDDKNEKAKSFVECSKECDRSLSLGKSGCRSYYTNKEDREDCYRHAQEIWLECMDKCR